MCVCVCVYAYVSVVCKDSLFTPDIQCIYIYIYIYIDSRNGEERGGWGPGTQGGECNQK